MILCYHSKSSFGARSNQICHHQISKNIFFVASAGPCLSPLRPPARPPDHSLRTPTSCSPASGHCVDCIYGSAAEKKKERERGQVRYRCTFNITVSHRDLLESPGVHNQLEVPAVCHPGEAWSRPEPSKTNKMINDFEEPRWHLDKPG